MRDLLEKLAQLQLNEAPVQPGERKGISFKLKKLDKVNSQLQQYKNSLSHMQMTKLPPDLQKEMDQLQQKLNTEIAKVQQAYEVEYEKSKVNDRPVKMDNLFKALAKNCKEIIKVYKELNRNNFSREKFLFRGIKSSDDALYGKPFEARKPKDSNRDLHELVNGAINSLGYTANRENAMFVTGDRSQAAGYGHALYIMFPVDGFTFTWSQTVKDLVLDNGKKLDMMDKNIVEQIKEIVKQAQKQNPEDFPITYPEDLFRNGYDYENDRERLMRAVETGKIPDEVEDLLDDVITNSSIQEHFKFTDNNLFSAILSEKEIYIRGDYYAVNFEHREELFKFLEQINTDNVELPENFGEVPNVLDKGDVVTIINGTHQGKLGTITYVYSNEYEVFLTQKAGDITINKTDVELYKLPDGSIPVFEKGDEVIVTDTDARQYGMVGTLNFVYPTGKVEFTDKDNNYYTLFKNQITAYSPELEQQIVKDLETKPPTIEANDLVIVSDPDSEYYKERGKVNYAYSTGTIEVYFAKKSLYADFQPEQLTLLKNAGPELLDTEQGVFHVGDKVQISGGEYQGYYGTVEYLYSQGTKAEIDLTGMDKKVDVYLTDLQHYGKEKEAPKFKVGDKVKIMVGDNKGEEAIVNYVSSVFPDEIDVKLIKNDYLKTVPTSGVELVADEPIKQDAADAPSGIKVGDTIQVVDSDSGYFGEVGEVIELGTNDSGMDWVKFKNENYPAGIKTFASFANKVEQKVQTFKKNDKFKVKEKSFSVDGAIATVLDGPDSDGDYKAVTDDGKIIYTAPFQMEKIEDTAETFTAGDKVKIMVKSSGFYGDIGEITKGPDKDGDYVVIFNNDDDEWSYFQANELEKILPSPHQIKKDEIANLNWEPEPEVAPPQSPFTEGDKVEVVSQFPSLIGMTGTILQTNPKYGFVSVQLDDNTEPSSFPVSALKKIDQQQEVDTSSQTTSDFSISDTIEVVNPALSTYGKQGTVIDMNQTFVFVDFNGDGSGESALKPVSVKKIG